MKPPNLSRPGSRVGAIGLVAAALCFGLVGACGWQVNPGPAPLVTAQRAPVVVLPAAHGDPEVLVEVRAGSAYDPVGREGLAFQAAMLVQHAGTATRTADQVAAAWAGWGAELSVDVGVERVLFRVKAPAAHVAAAAGLLAELVVTPTLDASALDHARFAGVRAATATDMDAADLAGLLITRMIYEGHPYGHPVAGRLTTANLVSALDVSQFRERRYLRSVVAGAVVGLPEGSPEALAAADALRAGLDQLPPRLSRDVTPRLPPTRESRSVALLGPSRQDQERAALGHSLDTRWTDPDGPALLVAVEALDARLEAALGGAPVDARWVEAFTAIQGRLVVDVPLSSSRTLLPPTLDAMTLFAQDGIDGDELAAARRVIVERLGHDPNRGDWTLASLLLGSPDPLTALPPLLDGLTPAAVNAAIARWIHPDRLSIAIVAQDPEPYRQAFIEYPDASGVQAGGYALGVKSLTVVSIEELNP